MIDWEPLWEIIHSNERFVLTSHVRPDADALGSELGMAGLLQGMGKTVKIINPSASPSTLFFLDEQKQVCKLGQTATAEEILEADVHMVLDTSAWQQISTVGEVLKKSKAQRVVIDHHVSSDDLGAIEFKDTIAEATGTLVYRFIKSGPEITMTREMANALYCAIATDTGWFRFPATTSETMRIIGELIDAGAQPHELYNRLYEQRTHARILLMARVLGRVKTECNNKLAWTCVEWNDFSKTGSSPVDTEGIVNECLTIAGTEAAFIAVEQQNKSVKVSFRSRSNLDVAAIAEEFGGGGHKAASGAMLGGPLRLALGRVLEAMKTAIED